MALLLSSRCDRSSNVLGDPRSLAASAIFPEMSGNSSCWGCNARLWSVFALSKVRPGAACCCGGTFTFGLDLKSLNLRPTLLKAFFTPFLMSNLPDAPSEETQEDEISEAPSSSQRGCGVKKRRVFVSLCEEFRSGVLALCLCFLFLPFLGFACSPCAVGYNRDKRDDGAF